MPVTRKHPLFAKMDFIESLARMKNERETEGGFGVEDLTDTVNNLIAEARKLTGIKPGHQIVYCPDCGGDKKGYGCACDNYEPEMVSSCDCGDYCAWCRPELCLP